MGINRSDFRRLTTKSGRRCSTLRATHSGRSRLIFESLEDRRMLAVVTVNTDQDVVDFDDGVTSLREALFAANLVEGADEIVFDFGHDGPATILLTGGELTITDSVVITGPGQDLLTIDAQQNSRVLNYSATSGDLSLAGLTLQNGLTTGSNSEGSRDTTFSGGGVRFVSEGGTLTLTNTTLTDNRTTGDRASGGGLFSSRSPVMLVGCTVTGNRTSGDNAAGGGVVFGGSIVVTSSTFSGNQTSGENSQGGGLFGTSLEMIGSTVSGNSTAGKNSHGGGFFGRIVKMVDSTVTGNSTSGENSRGGGLYGREVEMIGSTVARNSTTGDFAGGGGIIGTELTLARSDISDNSTTGEWAYGGGIGVSGGVGHVTLVDSAVSGNKTIGTFSIGGGIGTVSFSGVSISLTNSTLSGNSTAGRFAPGGGIGIMAGGTVTLNTSTVSGNSTSGEASFGGGVHIHSGGLVTLTSSTLSENSTTGYYALGGGIHSHKVVITNSTVSSNSTSGDQARGGAIVSTGAVEIASSTLVNNRTAGADAEGGGVSIRNYRSGSVPILTIRNSILAGNHVAGMSTGPEFFQQASFDAPLVIEHSLIGDNAGTGLAESHEADSNGNLIGGSASGLIDPLLGPLGYYGGATQTHNLLPRSPALDAGDPAILYDQSYDQRGGGFFRVANGRIDIGAYEAQVMPSADFDLDNDVDGADFLTWQRGYATINVLHADGNSNGDEHVDATDLLMWSTSYGQFSLVGESTLLAVGALASPNQIALAQPKVVDLVALATMQTTANTRAKARGQETPAIEVVLAASGASNFWENDLGTANSVSEEALESLANDNATSKATTDIKPWISVNLLERIFE